MPQFLVSIHRRDDYDPSTETKEMARDIDALNDEMVTQGMRVFVGGLHLAKNAKSISFESGDARFSDGPYLKTNEHVGGFWVLNLKTFAEAMEWGRKASCACRAAVEVREFHSRAN